MGKLLEVLPDWLQITPPMLFRPDRYHPLLRRCALSIVVAASLAGSAATADEGSDFFEKKIRPLLAEHCYKCHSSQAKKLKANLFLDSRDGWMKGGDSGPAIVPGEPDASPLIKAVGYADKDLQMPPKNRSSRRGNIGQGHVTQTGD